MFSIHAGEFLVGEHIERHFPRANVWLPARDSGIDLLVTDQGNEGTLSLQVKFSRDFLATHMAPAFQASLRACGWWSLNASKIEESVADYWVLVLLGFNRRTTDFVVIPPKELLRRFRSIHGSAARIQSYVWVATDGRCWETRGLRRDDQLRVAAGEYSHSERDLTAYLNNWAPLERLVSGRGEARAERPSWWLAAQLAVAADRATPFPASVRFGGGWAWSRRLNRCPVERTTTRWI